MLTNLQEFTKKHPFYSALVLSFITAVGSILLGYAVQNRAFMHVFDDPLYIAINKLPSNWLTNAIVWPFNLWFIKVRGLNMPAYFYIFLALILVYGYFKNKKTLVWIIVAIIIGTQIVNYLLLLDWYYVFRERPYTRLPSNEYMSNAAKKALEKWPSYPSGHTRDTAMYATVFSYFFPELMPILVIFSLFIAFTRVYTGAHYPTDALSGLLLGFLCGVITIYLIKTAQHLVNRFWKKHDKTEETK